jgi:enamine deaminase RidA (YjgF/YER057c/UK114 family)
MTTMHHLRPEGSPPAAGYSHAVSASGRLIVVSGQVPVDANGDLVGPGDPEAQVRQVFRNLVVALGAAGATMAEVVKLGYFLTDLADLPVVRRVRDEFIDVASPPASTLVQVSGLVHPGYRVEIEALAALSD